MHAPGSIKISVDREGKTIFTDSLGGVIKFDQSDPQRLSINSSSSEAEGTPIYQSIYAWAHNTGGKVVGDPIGSTTVGSFRRMSHMFSSAMRFKTTRHFEPDPSHTLWLLDKPPSSKKLKEIEDLQDEWNLSFMDVANQARIEQILLEEVGWRKDAEGFEHNLGLLARAEQRMAFDALKKRKIDYRQFSFRDGQFYQKGQPIPFEGRFSALREPISALDPDFAGGTGPRTLARALATDTAERSGRRAGGDLGTAANQALESVRYAAQPGRELGPGQTGSKSPQVTLQEWLDSIDRPVDPFDTKNIARRYLNTIGLERGLEELIDDLLGEAPPSGGK